MIIEGFKFVQKVKYTIRDQVEISIFPEIIFFQQRFVISEFQMKILLRLFKIWE